MEQIFSNAQIVLPHEIVSGSVKIQGGKISHIDTGASQHGEDFGGDYLLPGLVELHTDHLENHYGPRPGVRWNAISAIQSHDAQIASSGITTVFDCFRIGTDSADHAFEPGEMRDLAGVLAHAQEEGRLRADHLIHLRCEVSSPGAVEEFATFDDADNVALVSLMDHAPGQRQFQTMEQYTLYYKTKRGLSDEAFAKFVEARTEQSKTWSHPQRREIAKACRSRGITLASHDDATLGHVEEAKEAGVRLAEFPTSVEAARASHDAGMSVLMGAPNIVRGKSHSGNIAARDLAEAGILDVLSSDYVPLSLIHGPFALVDKVEAIDLPTAMRMVTQTPAKTVGLEDRGAIETGKRADIIRVSRKQSGDVPVVRAVWREGERVA